MENTFVHIPALRLGIPYKSLDTTPVVNHRTGETLAEVSHVNAGIVRRDLTKYAAGRAALRKIKSADLIARLAAAGQLFVESALSLGDGKLQTPDDYVRTLSASSGLPFNMVRSNMKKIQHVFTEVRTILRGLTRGLDLRALDTGIGEQSGAPVSFFPLTQALGIVLPSNSPGVNSLWLPAIALKIPVVIKPGREEPWTPFRIIQACIAAGIPAEAFGYYPTDHEGAAEIVNSCGRALLFGDEATTARWAGNPNVQIHGPGHSKILIGEDCIEHWRGYMDVIADSISRNGGRSCVNASAVIVPRYAKEIAEELGRRLGPIAARGPEDDAACLSGFANVKMSDWIDETIEEGLKAPGATDVTAVFRGGPRKQSLNGGVYLRPTVIHCENFSHPLANREFLFPYASVVQVAQKDMLSCIGHSLVVTAITEDAAFIDDLLCSPLIDRLNLGPLPTVQVSWDQPHEGNLFEFLYRQRALLVGPPPLRKGTAS